MNEAKKGQIVVFLTEFGKLEGTIGEVLEDRIFVHYYKQDENEILKLQDGDSVKTVVHTRSGVKKMYPLIIEKDKDYIIIENAPTIPEAQNREDVRLIVEKNLEISIADKIYYAKSIDISAGGVKFEAEDKPLLNINDIVKIEFKDEELPPEKLNAKILKQYGENIFVAQFFDNNVNIINKVSKFCMGNFG